LLRHFEDQRYAATLSAIANTGPYLTDPDLKAGCVHYPTGVAAMYSGDVIIEPRASHRQILTYDELEVANARGELTDFGPLPNFSALFKNAIQNSLVLNRKEKAAWLTMLL